MSAEPTPAERVAASRALLETECTVERVRSRFALGSACTGCGATNPFVLVEGSSPLVCYACRVRHRVERDHTTGHHRGPRLPLPPNLHRLRSEVERIARLILLPGVRMETACGLVTYMALRFALLGTIGDRP